MHIRRMHAEPAGGGLCTISRRDFAAMCLLLREMRRFRCMQQSQRDACSTQQTVPVVLANKTPARIIRLGWVMSELVQGASAQTATDDGYMTAKCETVSCERRPRPNSFAFPRSHGSR